eukprot:3865871-Rhodomonas_salina.1
MVDRDIVIVRVSQLWKVVWCLNSNSVPCSHPPTSLDNEDEHRCSHCCSPVSLVYLLQWRFPQLGGRTKSVCARKACVESSLSKLINLCCCYVVAAAWSIDVVPGLAGRLYRLADVAHLVSDCCEWYSFVLRGEWGDTVTGETRRSNYPGARYRGYPVAGCQMNNSINTTR